MTRGKKKRTRGKKKRRRGKKKRTKGKKKTRRQEGKDEGQEGKDEGQEEEDEGARRRDEGNEGHGEEDEGQEEEDEGQEEEDEGQEEEEEGQEEEDEMQEEEEEGQVRGGSIFWGNCQNYLTIPYIDDDEDDCDDDDERDACTSSISESRKDNPPISRIALFSAFFAHIYHNYKQEHHKQENKEMHLFGTAMYHNRKIGSVPLPACLVEHVPCTGQEENEKFQRLHVHRLTEKRRLPLASHQCCPHQNWRECPYNSWVWIIAATG
eukprot:g47326.t1